MNNNIASEFYTVSEVAKILKVSKSYVYELIYSNRIPSIKLSERRIRILKESLNNFIKEEIDKPIANNIIIARPPKRGRKPKHGIN